MKIKIFGLVLAIILAGVIVPAGARAQNLAEGLVKRDKNGIKLGNSQVSLLNGPGIVNYDYHHEWLPGAGGAATVIGAGAGGGALVGGLISKKDRKKGAIIGAVAGGGAGAVVWLYKNRTERRAIF